MVSVQVHVNKKTNTYEEGKNNQDEECKHLSTICFLWSVKVSSSSLFLEKSFCSSDKIDVVEYLQSNVCISIHASLHRYFYDERSIEKK